MLRGACRLGNVPLEVAPLLVVELNEKVLTAWRADCVESSDDASAKQRANSKDEACGEITGVKIAKNRLERGLMRADCTVDVSGRKIKLWLPRPRALRALWLSRLRTQVDVDESSTGDDEDAVEEVDTTSRVAAVWKRLDAEKNLPPGWEALVDQHTGNDYYFDQAARETTWTRPQVAVKEQVSSLSAHDLALAWLLQQTVSAEVDALAAGTAGEAPVLASLVEDVKECPLVAREGWASAVDGFASTLPKLIECTERVRTGRAIALEENEDQNSPTLERGGRFHVSQAAAQPLFFLSQRLLIRQSQPTGSLEDKLSVALRAFVADMRSAGARGEVTGGLLPALTAAGSGVASLPDAPRRAVEAALPILVLRLCRATRPRSERCRRIKAGLDALPRATLVGALRVGAFPSSPSFVQGLVDLGVRAKIRNGETLAQRLARANLGLDDPQFKTRFDALPPPLRAHIDKADDEALENIDVDLARKAGVPKLDDATTANLKRAASLEAYRRAAERLVAAYGDQAYVDLVSTLYPALFEPLAAILVHKRVKAADALDSIFDLLANAVKRASSARHLYTDYDRLICVDADLRALADTLVDTAKRAVCTDLGKWSAVLAWAFNLAQSCSLDLASVSSQLPHYEDDDADDEHKLTSDAPALQADLDFLVKSWNDTDQDIGALAFVTKDQLPALATRLPAFTAHLREQWHQHHQPTPRPPPPPAAGSEALSSSEEESADMKDIPRTS